MTITGKYERDNNFTIVYTENAMYTIARKTGYWDYVKVGDIMANGHILTKEIFDAWKSECEKEGTFELSE